MNERLAKKLRKVARKYTQKNWKEYIEEIRTWPFSVRLRFSWYIVTHGKKAGSK